jgi:hypothetical protein
METGDWEPISKEELEDRLAREIDDFEPSDHQLWSRYKVSLRGATVFRSETYGTENVFVVAAEGAAVIFFDDEEDEFAVGRVDEHGSIKNWGLCGELRYALRGFPRNAA